MKWLSLGLLMAVTVAAVPKLDYVDYARRVVCGRTYNVSPYVAQGRHGYQNESVFKELRALGWHRFGNYAIKLNATTLLFQSRLLDGKGMVWICVRNYPGPLKEGLIAMDLKRTVKCAVPKSAATHSYLPFRQNAGKTVEAKLFDHGLVIK